MQHILAVRLERWVLAFSGATDLSPHTSYGTVVAMYEPIGTIRQEFTYIFLLQP